MSWKHVRNKGLRWDFFHTSSVWLRIVLPGFLIAISVYANPTEIDAGSNPVITIEEAVWTNGVNRETRAYQERYDEIAPIAPLYLWMRISGKDEALEWLKSGEKLPIRHKWYHVIGTSIISEGSETPASTAANTLSSNERPTDQIELTIGYKAQINALGGELQGKGMFDWRTWSMKQNISSGIWIVQVVYADNSPVLCGTEPCEYSIEVQ